MSLSQPIDTASPRPARFDVDSVGVSAVTLTTAVETFFSICAEGGGCVVVASAHGIVESRRDGTLCQIMNNAALVLPDGMPLAVIGQAKAGNRVGRTPGVEFFSAVLGDERASEQRHFFYGSDPATVEQVIGRALRSLSPEAIAGWYCPPFRQVGAREDGAVLETIRKAGSTVVWVGLSTPKQEYWMRNHMAALPGVTLVGVGAAFDFLAENKARGPKFLRRNGLEWVYRLWTEPARLWPRYRYVVPRMAVITVKEIARSLRSRKYRP